MPRFLTLGLLPSLLPIGHERDSVRRTPVVTLWIIVSCTIVLVLCQVASTPSRAEKEAMARAFGAMFQFWEAHPHLEPTEWDEWLRDHLPEDQARALAEFAPLSPEEGKEPDFEAQDRLEELAEIVVLAFPEDPRDR